MLKDSTVQEDEGVECLFLGGGGDVPVENEVVEEGGNGIGSEGFGRFSGSFEGETEVVGDPLAVCFFGGDSLPGHDSCLAFFSFSPGAVSRPSTDQRTQHRPPESHAHRPAVDARAESPEFLDGLLRAGNDNGVKAEEKTGQGGGQGPEDKSCLHNARDVFRIIPG